MYCQPLLSNCKRCGVNSDRKTIIRSPTNHDVLFGRGGSINSHEGNVLFRHVVNQYKDAYMRANKHCKPKIANKVVSVIYNLNPPGRFLAPVNDSQKNYKKDGCISWYNVGLKKARAKASQCLRERIRCHTKHKQSISQEGNNNVKVVSKSSSTFSCHSQSSPTMVLRKEEDDLPDFECRNQVFHKRHICDRNNADSRIYGDSWQSKAFPYPPPEISYTRFYYPKSHDVNVSYFGVYSNDDKQINPPHKEEEQEQLISCSSWIGSFFSVEYNSLGTSLTFMSPLLPERKTIQDVQSTPQFPVFLPSSSSTVSDLTYLSDHT
jgi:hypothetical protein